MNNLIRAELYKLGKDRVFRTLLLILAATAIAYPFFVYFDNISDGDPQNTGSDFLLDAIAGNGYMIKFGLSILAGFFIASEYSTGVMKSIASSGNGRGRLFTAKLTGFAIGAMAISLVFPVLCTAVASLLSGFGHLPEGASSLYILRSLFLTLLYAAGFSAIAALFATMLAESGKTIGFSIIFFLMIDSLLAGASAYVPFFNTIYHYSVFKLLGDIGKVSLDSGALPALLLVPLLTIAAAGLLGFLIYRRKEIK